MLGASKWVEARNTARHPIMGRTAQIKSQPNIIDAEKLTAEIMSPGSRLAAHHQTCQRDRDRPEAISFGRQCEKALAQAVLGEHYGGGC